MSKENPEKDAEGLSMGQIEIDTTRFDKEPDTTNLSVLPTRNLALFPGVTVPLSIGRESSLELTRRASESCEPIAVICQLDPSVDNPAIADLYKYGVIADVFRVIEMPDNTHTAILRARDRIRVAGKGADPSASPTGLAVKVKVLSETAPKHDERFVAAVEQCIGIAGELIEDMSHMAAEFTNMVRGLKSPAMQVNYIATNAPISAEAKEKLLATGRLSQRADLLLSALLEEQYKMRVRHEVMMKAAERMKDNQRSAVLQQQLDTIKEELYGENAPDNDSDAGELLTRADAVAFPAEVRQTFDKEVGKLRRLNPQSPDYSVQYAYLETLLELPWQRYTQSLPAISDARQVLETNHYGLEKVKQRILEQIAVYFNNGANKSSIICLVGPPGVGKTSLGRSIAAAVGRSYQRVSLGGVHDESEIRGHRRTYVGAMPGRIIKALRAAGCADPVLVLDEVDKLGNDHRGDPSDALLEVLDPEQNSTFHDNYIDIDFDLSKVMFIATANTLSTVPPALLDRMEVIDISGYLLEEKLEIARRHLLPAVLADLNLGEDDFAISDEALTALIERYTAESGVRQLQKRLASLARKTLLAKLEGKPVAIPVQPDDLLGLLGLPTHQSDKTEEGIPGVVTGLAWTQVGGEILLAEASLSPAKSEKLTITGNLGDVMKESVIIARQWICAHADKLGIAPDVFDHNNLHVHFPEGAIPKDGPSAGITIATAIASALTGRPARPHLAMTGEITLRGRVLPVGGIKEKILAAKRAGVTDIVLSEDNRRDIEEIPAQYLAGMSFHYVTDVEQVLDRALT